MEKKYLFVIGGILLLIVVAGIITYYIRSVATERAQNEAVKTLFSDDVDAKFLDQNSNQISLDAYKDTILVVNVWASWSPYTAIEFPILDELSEQFKEKGVRFLVMNRKESQAQIERYLATIPEYKNLERIIDVNDFFYAGIDGYAMPETIIYDANGKIIQHIRGVVVKNDLENVLNQLLEAQE